MHPKLLVHCASCSPNMQPRGSAYRRSEAPNTDSGWSNTHPPREARSGSSVQLMTATWASKPRSTRVSKALWHLPAACQPAVTVTSSCKKRSNLQCRTRGKRCPRTAHICQTLPACPPHTSAPPGVCSNERDLAGWMRYWQLHGVQLCAASSARHQNLPAAPVSA